MKRLPSLLAFAALAFAPTLAKADPITYTFNQTLVQDANDHATVTGTVTTDGTLGLVFANNIVNYDLFLLTETGLRRTASLELSTALGGGALPYGSGYLDADAGTLSFDYSQPDYLTFGGYGTGTVSFLSGYEAASIRDSPSSIQVGATGVQVIATAVPSSVTPEPSSLILMGTGALGLAGTIRRRIVR